MHFPIFSTLTVLAFITGKVDLKLVDLTHILGPSPPNWPGDPPYIFTILYRQQFDDYWYELNKFETVEHIGTHLDAPAHFSEGSKRVHEIPMEKLAGPGVIINVKAKVAENLDYQVSKDDLEAWESKHNKTIPNGSVVIMNSGWSSKFPNASLLFGTETPDNASTFHFPGWKKESVDWLITERFVNAIGVDTPSTDFGQSATFPVHQRLGKGNVPGVELVANLDSIPEYGSTIYVAVIRIYEGSGGPARVFATFQENEDDDEDSESESDSETSEESVSE
ncbi:isatin hydrolase-like [Mercenaria mercenaria]|uniref:isatin hydrolase-like n=1 Tax=Mercenaria mercenaria TaxID=6596 RepID=UPI00234E5598|nr:isatin hydrolase-like [Mercenaria mercenaria]